MSTTNAAAASPQYLVPALEKGLDILECLAAQRVALTQAQLSRLLGRGPNELFRMLICLERRGYIQRDPASGAYSLTLRLFSLSHTHSPVEGLLRAAAQPMRRLCEELRESCHLGVLHRGELLVVAQEESPAKLRLSVEVGAGFPLLHTVSGRLLLAYLTPQQRDATLQGDQDWRGLSAEQQVATLAHLAKIRARGYEEAYGETTDGVRDLVVPVGSSGGPVLASLAVASLGRKGRSRVDAMLPALRSCAEAIARAAGI